MRNLYFAALGSGRLCTFKVITYEVGGYPLPPAYWNHGVRGPKYSKILIRLDLYGKYSGIRTYRRKKSQIGAVARTYCLLSGYYLSLQRVDLRAVSPDRYTLTLP